MNKWTKGPWFVDRAGRGAGYKVACHGKKRAGGGNAICSIRPANRSDAALDEAADNARLIAAAPELVEALRDARSFIDVLINAHWGGELKVSEEESAAIEKIEAALAKAGCDE